MIWIVLYFAAGIVALGALGFIDGCINDIRTDISAQSICIPIIGIMFWPIAALCLLDAS